MYKTLHKKQGSVTVQLRFARSSVTFCAKRDNYCEKYIPQIHPNVPDATYLVWLDCRELGMSNEELSRFMVEKAGLGLSDGYTFGRSLSGYMRLNAACPRSVLKQALEQLRAAVEAL